MTSCELGWKTLGVLELTALPSIDEEHWAPMVQQTDALLVGGGDPLYLCYWMQQSGLADRLPSLRETVYVGLSAGSMVMTPNIGEDFVRWSPPTGGDRALGKEKKMDHVVYLDAKAKEFDSLLSAKKTMIIRGAAGRKLPHGRVNKDDILYFINNNAEGVILAKAKVKSVFNSDKMNEEESVQLVNSYQDKLQLTKQQFDRWAGKRYLVLIEVTGFEKVEPFQIDKSSYGNMDDWLLVEQIDKVRIKNKG